MKTTPRKDGAATLLSPVPGGKSAAPPMARRDFFDSACRIALGSGLAALGVFLVARNKICLKRGVCRSCTAYAKCELPQKEKLR
jgi:hypothetical protein